MDKEERQLLQEYNAEDVHKKALAVCELITECKSLRTALTLQGLAASDFYRARREHKDIEQAWNDAQQLLAELKIGDLSDLSERLINDEGLTHNTFTAVTKNERWIVEKLNPDRYGAHPHQQTAGFVQNNVQILQQLTDEQIMRLAGASVPLTAITDTPAVTSIEPTANNLQKTLDTPVEATYTEVSSEDISFDTGASYAGKSPFNNKCSPYFADNQLATATTPDGSNTQPTAGGYDLSAFGDLT